MIAFRNTHHADWFYKSIGYLVICTAAHMYYGKTILLFVAGGGHLAVSISAIILVSILKKDTEVVSGGCIWFNALVAAAYLTIFRFVHPI